jgi:hypothetical protein
MSEDKKDEAKNQDQKGKKKLGKVLGFAVDEPFCPVCADLDHKETLHAVKDLEQIARNPQVDKGAPRVVDCSGGCRFGLEPFYNPRSDGTFCYMLLRSERNPEARVNHYWFKPEWIKSE